MVCTIGSRGEVPGERKPAIRDYDDKSHKTLLEQGVLKFHEVH
jgi:hypothetical protein